MKKSENQAELKLHEKIVPKGSMVCMVTATMPLEMRIWVNDEANSRDIPTTWVIVEMLYKGIEATKAERGNGSVDIT